MGEFPSEACGRCGHPRRRHFLDNGACQDYEPDPGDPDNYTVQCSCEGFSEKKIVSRTELEQEEPLVRIAAALEAIQYELAGIHQLYLTSKH